MHSFLPGRSHKTSQVSWSSTDSVFIIPSRPETSSTMSLRSSTRNTGFPDSFDGRKSPPPQPPNNTHPNPPPPQSDRNTCLPHPDAIIAPDATITEADVTFARAAARHRMSLQANAARAAAADPQHPVTDSSTYCASPTSHDSAVSQLALSSLRGADLSRNREGPHDHDHDHDHGKSDADSLHSGGSVSPTHPPARSGGREKSRRRSFLGKLMHR